MFLQKITRFLLVGCIVTCGLLGCFGKGVPELLDDPLAPNIEQWIDRAVKADKKQQVLEEVRKLFDEVVTRRVKRMKDLDLQIETRAYRLLSKEGGIANLERLIEARGFDPKQVDPTLVEQQMLKKLVQMEKDKLPMADYVYETSAIIFLIQSRKLLSGLVDVCVKESLYKTQEIDNLILAIAQKLDYLRWKTWGSRPIPTVIK